MFMAEREEKKGEGDAGDEKEELNRGDVTLATARKRVDAFRKEFEAYASIVRDSPDSSAPRYSSLNSIKLSRPAKALTNLNVVLNVMIVIAYLAMSQDETSCLEHARVDVCNQLMEIVRGKSDAGPALLIIGVGIEFWAVHVKTPLVDRFSQEVVIVAIFLQVLSFGFMSGLWKIMSLSRFLDELEPLYSFPSIVILFLSLLIRLLTMAWVLWKTRDTVVTENGLVHIDDARVQEEMMCMQEEIALRERERQEAMIEEAAGQRLEEDEARTRQTEIAKTVVHFRDEVLSGYTLKKVMEIKDVYMDTMVAKPGFHKKMSMEGANDKSYFRCFEFKTPLNYARTSRVVSNLPIVEEEGKPFRIDVNQIRPGPLRISHFETKVLIDDVRFHYYILVHKPVDVADMIV